MIDTKSNTEPAAIQDAGELISARYRLDELEAEFELGNLKERFDKAKSVVRYRVNGNETMCWSVYGDFNNKLVEDNGVFKPAIKRHGWHNATATEANRTLVAECGFSIVDFRNIEEFFSRKSDMPPVEDNEPAQIEAAPATADNGAEEVIDAAKKEKPPTKRTAQENFKLTEDYSMIDLKSVQYTPDMFGVLPEDSVDEVYLELTKIDIAEAQEHLDDLPESQRRGLTLETLRHFGCGYLRDWVLTKSRAEFLCGIYVDEFTGERKKLPPPSERIIIPTASMNHFNGVATPAARYKTEKTFWKQHARTKELFGDTEAFNADLIIVVEGELDAMTIWQCSAGTIAAVAILGCSNWKKTVLPRIDALRGKKLIVMLDADAAGVKEAKKFIDELKQRGCLAVAKTLYEAINPAIRKEFDKKVDANDILRNKGDDFLRRLLDKIIDDAAPDFDKAQAAIDAQNLFMQEQAALPDATIETPAKHGNGIDLTKHGYNETQARTPGEHKELPADIQKLVDAVNNITYKELMNKGVLKHSEHGAAAPKGFICPWCNSGLGTNKTGALQFYTAKNDNHVHCHALHCGGDVFALLAKHYGKGQTGKDFFDVLKQAAADFEIKYDPAIFERNHSDGAVYMNGLTEDLDNARRLAKFCGDRAKWLTDAEHWLIWNRKGVWEKRSEKNSCLAHEADAFADLMMTHAGKLFDEVQQAEQEYRKATTKEDGTTRTDGSPEIKAAKDKLEKANARKDKAFKIAQVFRRAGKVSSAISMLKGCSNVRITQDDLDNHGELLNCLNGVVNLEDGTLMDLRADRTIATRRRIFCRNSTRRRNPRRPSALVRLLLDGRG